MATRLIPGKPFHRDLMVELPWCRGSVDIVHAPDYLRMAARGELLYIDPHPDLAKAWLDAADWLERFTSS